MPVANRYLDEFKVKNVSSRPVTLGDLVNVTIGPGRILDLLKQPRVTKDKINQSQDLQLAFRMGVLQRLEERSPSTKTRDERAATIADELQGGTEGTGTGTGTDGAVGATGPVGPTGPQGPAGGPTGPIGATGAPGPPGADGADGADGATGPAGTAGPGGPVGPTGPIGPSGGPTGPIGATGTAGQDGIIGVDGVTGPQGPEGEVGATGTAGQDGIIGVDGVTGPQGPEGEVGATGTAGQDGIIGIDGVTGPAGPAGGAGEAGATGPQGPAGSGGGGSLAFKELNVLAQSAGDLNLSDSNWEISKSRIDYIRIDVNGSVTDFDIAFYENSIFYDIDIRYAAEGLNSTDNWQDDLEWIYVDEDNLNQIHLRITENSGSGTYDIHVRGVELL